MARSLQEKIGSVLERRNPDGFSVTESFACDEADDISKYVRLAMEAVDEAATKKSKDAAASVKDLLVRNISNASFQYQGSIMTDTHIKGASDVDLLILSERFFGCLSMGSDPMEAQKSVNGVRPHRSLHRSPKVKKEIKDGKV